MCIRDRPYPTGTAVTVRCPMAKFQTVKPDRKAAQSDFHHLVMYDIEELRYIYAGVLADTNSTMKVLEVNGCLLYTSRGVMQKCGSAVAELPHFIAIYDTKIIQ